LLADSDYRNLRNTDSVKADFQLKVSCTGKEWHGLTKTTLLKYIKTDSNITLNNTIHLFRTVYLRTA